MKLYLIFLVLLSSCPLLLADDIKTLNGGIYQDVVVTGTDAVSVSIIHKTGATRILFQELPADLQKKYGYDSAKEKEYLEKLREARSLKASTEQPAAVTPKTDANNQKLISTSQPEESPPKTASTVESSGINKFGDGATGATTPTGKTIYEGPRGGHYHISKTGKKVYEKRK